MYGISPSSESKSQQTNLASGESQVVAYLQKCAKYFQSLGGRCLEMMKFVHMFPSMELKREFLKVGHMEELLKLEEAAGNFKEAEGIAEELGRWEHSAELSLKAGEPQRALARLLHIAQVQYTWDAGDGRDVLQKS